jgi:acyl-CoA synthetase (AMP-forming)/AMP-acid ligase II
MFDERLGSEVIVMVCERQPGDDQPEPAEIKRYLRRGIVEQTEVTLADVRLVERRWLIKTSSGKIARSDNREKYIREFRS